MSKIKPPCEKCFGQGFTASYSAAKHKAFTKKCKACKGTGNAPEDTAEDIPLFPLRVEIRVDEGTGFVTLKAAGETDFVTARMKIGSIHRPHANCHRIEDERKPASGDSVEAERLSAEIVQRLTKLWKVLK